MAKKISKTEHAPDFGIVQINYRMPAVLHAEAEKRCGSEISIQNLITLSLAAAWEVDPPEVRGKGRPKKEKDVG